MVSQTPPQVSDAGTSAAATPIIEIQGLVKRYNDFTAVKGIDLEVRTGEIFGILGPNGAGKTTTLEMIEGLRTPDEGTIRVAGLDAVADNDKIRKIIGVQLQTTALFPYLSARELVELFAAFYEVENPPERAIELLKLVNLEEKAKNRIEELSGGQQQRLSIALALVNTPTITFLDEPTTGLDPHARRNLWQTVFDVRAAGTTVVLTTHYMEEAEILCDRIAVMDNGQVIACDTPEGLIRDLPQDATVSATIVENGTETVTEADLTAIPGVTTAAISLAAVPPTITAQTSNVQSTLVGLLQFAEQRGMTLGELTSTRASLEDVFLYLTGRSYERHDETPPEAENAGKKKRRRG